MRDFFVGAFGEEGCLNNEMKRKGTDMKGKGMKGTEKTPMDRLEHELKESERQVLSAGGKPITRSDGAVILYIDM